jgi:diguanylate cyclase (GGDEF)-like protein/PAS domain S-box-containing protein
VTEVLGWRPEEVLGKAIVGYIHPDDLRPGILDSTRPDRVEFEGRVRQSDGDYRWIDITSRPVLDDSGDVVSRVGRLRDIAAKKEAEEALRQSEQRFRTAMASAPTGMAVVSLDREFVEVNPALCRLLGRSEQWLIGHGLHDVLDPQDDELDHLLRQDLLRGAAQSLTRDHQMVHANGRRVLVEQSVGLLRDPSGQPTGFVSQFADVTEARRARDQLRFLATHDSLTELLNRRELVARVSGILGQTPRTGQNIGILFIDLDRLKPINDTYGHAVGDEVIVTVARRLRDRVRASDVVARFGGDEFVVVLPAVHTAADAERIARVLHEGVRQPISHDGVLIRTTMSVGAVVVAPGSDPDLALRQADEALYAAKRQGRNRTVVYPV